LREGREICFPYLPDREPWPCLEARISNPVSGSSFPSEGWEPIPIDTGYEGFLLIPEDLYRALSCWMRELPRTSWPTFLMPDGRTVRGRAALLKIEIKEVITADIVSETFPGCELMLIGRALLRSLEVRLVGPEQKACVLRRSE